MMQLLRLGVRAAGAVALAALVVTSLPHLSRQADAQSTVAAQPAVDPSNIDPTCKACDDFFQFATGGWMKKAKIPTGLARWGSFDELQSHNREVLHAILEDAAKNTSAQPGSDEQKLAAFYRSCMNTDAIEAAGTTPIQPLLDGVAAVKDTRGLIDEIVALQRSGVGSGLALFAQPDRIDSSKMIAGLSGGGLGMERSYYLEDRFATIRAAYRSYITAELSALGESSDRAAHDADAILAFETTIAKATPDRSELRDPLATYHPTPVAQLASMAPHVAWGAFFNDYGEGGVQSVSVTLPAVLTAFDTQLAATPLDTWKALLRFRILDRFAGDLPKRFDDPSFAFQNGVLRGVKERLPRWLTCTTATDQTLRDVLGRAYVARAFPPSAKARAVALVDNLQSTLRTDISSLDWMSPETKKAAIAKLDAYTKKIAYPDRWEDFSGLTVSNA
ncbi:MAG: peptidase, partial [Candidatus Eremiobacteraeota bacterium]|nr:peptidase [Candidatus Eremiobacteraeota bacterium]